MVEYHHINKSYEGEVAVKDISFTVDEGELFGLIGPDGAGKSTLFRILTTVLLPDSGHVLFDGRDVVEVISQGAAGSWQMANRYETMLDDHFEHGFAVDWMRKDLGICLDTADENGASLPVTALVDQFYKDVQKMGGGRWDTSSLYKRLQSV